MRSHVNIRVITFISLAISFLILANVSSVRAQNECNSLGAPVVQTGAIAAGDTAQTLRMFRDGRGTTCQFNRTQTTSAGSYLSDSYIYTNTSGGPICVFVDLDAVGCGVATNQLSIAAYLASYDPASILTNVISDPGLSTGGNFVTSMNFTVPAGGTYIIVVHNINSGTFCASYTFRKYETNGCRNPGFDAGNDGSADLALFRPSGGLATWLTAPVGSGTSTTQFGSAGDIPVPGDYTGDETSDLGVFRPTNGTWYKSLNPATNYGAQKWGIAGDVPVQGDYDRDGITDLAIFRPSDNNWYILRSSGNVYSQILWGSTGDKPVPADYDGDGRTDPAVYKPSNGLWTTSSSAGNYGSFTNQQLFGISTDIPVPADYDGDGKADIAVFRPSEGNWYIFRSSLIAAQTQVINFGVNGDVPQPADYDNDRKADVAVFRSSNTTWWVLRSTAGVFATTIGQAGDIPATAPNSVQ